MALHEVTLKLYVDQGAMPKPPSEWDWSWLRDDVELPQSSGTIRDVELLGAEEVRYVSAHKAARMLGVTPMTVTSWIRSGHIKAEKVGPSRNSAWRIHPDEISRIRGGRHAEAS